MVDLFWHVGGRSSMRETCWRGAFNINQTCHAVTLFLFFDFILDGKHFSVVTFMIVIS